MAEAPNQLQKPAGAETPASANEPVIHVMPAEFRAGKMPMSASPKPDIAAPPVAPVAPLAPVPPKALPPKPGLATKKRRLPPVLVIGLILFLAIVIGAVAVLLSLNQPTVNVAVNNTPVNVNTETPPEPTPTPTLTPTPTPIEPVGGADTDSDGLTDIEEILFGSDTRNPDSDGDTYLDGNEVYHLYNPRGNAPGLLVDTGFAREFTAEGLDFQVVYPSRWTAQLLETRGVIFKVPTGEFVQVSRVAKDASLDVVSWYLTQSPEVKAEDVTPLTTRQGYAGILSPDKLSTYLDLGDHVYIINYNVGDLKTINFLTTYQMIVNSFILKK